jgi:hypothetical protein
MSRSHKEHFQRTKELATSLSQSAIYDWLGMKNK